MSLFLTESLRFQSVQALGHRVKPRVGALREALYQPLLHLFALPEQGAGPENQVAPEERKVEEILRLPEGARPRAALARAKESAAVVGGGGAEQGGRAAREYKKRLERSLGKRWAVGKAVKYALKAVEAEADKPPVVYHAQVFE